MPSSRRAREDGKDASNFQNALTVLTVTKCIFEFLPLEDIKSCRAVCREWNFVAEPFLRKLGKVTFTESFRPANMLAYSETHLPELPFTSYKFFSNYENWAISEVGDFFVKWNRNIKSLELCNMTVSRKSYRRKKFDISPWIQLISDYLTELKVECFSNVNTKLIVSLDSLSKIKVLTLGNCIVTRNRTSGRVAPEKISIKDVCFKTDGKKLERTIVNDFFDFSKCSKIEIIFTEPLLNSEPRYGFDVSRDVLNADTFYSLEGIIVFNWKYADLPVMYKIFVNNN